MTDTGLHDWTIRSLSEPRYTVRIAQVNQAHADQVLADLTVNQWNPNDLVLEQTDPAKPGLWERVKGGLHLG